MTLQQLKKDLAGIRETLKPEEPEAAVIIYDVKKGTPEYTDEGRDRVIFYIPDNGRGKGVEHGTIH